MHRTMNGCIELSFRSTWVHTAFLWVHVTPSFVLCVCFVDRCLSLCPFSFGYCVVCSSSNYGFWLPLWYLWYQIQCLTEIKKESPEHSDILIIFVSVGVLLFLIIFIGMGCLVIYVKSKIVWCCTVRCRRKESTSGRHAGKTTLHWYNKANWHRTGGKPLNDISLETVSMIRY